MYGTEALARFRTEADAHLFPKDPTPPGLNARAIMVYPALVALATGVQLLRMWDSRPLDSVWAEDGGVWSPNRSRGCRSIRMPPRWRSSAR